MCAMFVYNYIYKTKGSPILLNHLSILKQFQHFCHRNKVTDFEKGLEFFAVFGGLDEQINLTQPLFEVVKTKLLERYGLVHKAVCNLYKSEATTQNILSAIALGDGREHAVFKRARVSTGDGEKIVDELVADGIITSQKAKPMGHLNIEQGTLSDKLYFQSPFVRFWFGFVSPFFKGIKEGNYDEVKERFDNRFSEFLNLIFIQLSQELLKQKFDGDDWLNDVRSYWDKDIELDIMAKTKSGKLIVGSCRYSNSKVKKSELTSLQEKCKISGINADIFVLFSKKGFSNELKLLKSENLKLFSVKNFKSLTKEGK